MAFDVMEEQTRMFEMFSERLTRSLPENAKSAAEEVLDKLDSKFGPFLVAHPIWHPLHKLSASGSSFISREEFNIKDDFKLSNAIIYLVRSNPEKLVSHVCGLPQMRCARIHAKALTTKLGYVDVTPVLVTCEWKISATFGDRLYRSSIIAPLLINQVMSERYPSETFASAHWDRNRFAELILGFPCGKTSSVIIDKPEGRALKRLWEALLATGMFGHDD